MCLPSGKTVVIRPRFSHHRGLFSRTTGWRTVVSLLPLGNFSEISGVEFRLRARLLPGLSCEASVFGGLRF